MSEADAVHGAGDLYVREHHPHVPVPLRYLDCLTRVAGFQNAKTRFLEEIDEVEADEVGAAIPRKSPRQGR